MEERQLHLALSQPVSTGEGDCDSFLSLTPYASAEFFYESEYGKWSDTAIYAGCLFPIGKHVQIDSYYEHQNNTGKSPNQQLNQLGLVLNFYF